MIWVHIAWTIVLFATFAAIVLWAWSAKRKDSFHSAANIPLEDEASEHKGRIKP